MNIIDKPWGFEKLIEKNNQYVLKFLYMKKDYQCSLQYHNLKHETIYVLSGKLLVLLEDKNIEMIAGDSLIIPPLTTHRMRALEDSEYLEASTPELDDVVRIEDDYGRI